MWKKKKLCMLIFFARFFYTNRKASWESLDRLVAPVWVATKVEWAWPKKGVADCLLERSFLPEMSLAATACNHFQTDSYYPLKTIQKGIY